MAIYAAHIAGGMGGPADPRTCGCAKCRWKRARAKEREAAETAAVD